MVKKIYISKKYLFQQCWIDSLKVKIEKNIFWDLAFQVVWFNQEFDEPIPSLNPCSKIKKDWLTKNNILDNIENNGQPGSWNTHHFNDKVAYFNHICQIESLIHYALMRFLLVLNSNKVKPLKTKKKLSVNKNQFVNDRICDIAVVEM